MKLEVIKPIDLPLPNSDYLKKSKVIADVIKKEIDKNNGCLSFKDFMDHALYQKDLGYYSSKRQIIGPDGDFITAPEIGNIFAGAIAKQCALAFSATAAASVLEIGAGKGSLAVDILQRLDQMNCLPEQYFIIEISEKLIKHQKKKLNDKAPEYSSVVSWITSVPDNFDGIIIANELLDAFPFERFARTNENVLQLFVSFEKDNFVYKFRKAEKQLHDYVVLLEKKLGYQLDDGYLSEVSFESQEWVKETASKINTGVLLLIDYGASRKDYYAANRNHGWTRCHLLHHAHNEPLIYPGIQDITTWVDFSAVADVAVMMDMKIEGFINQSQFILNSGFENDFNDFVKLDIKSQIELTRQIKFLTLPNQMGENFKCLRLSKNITLGEDWFNKGDRAYLL
jgi:SAM-dependent MidA family methyltransferase